MWTFLRQQQQRGAQLHARDRQMGEAPADAVADRSAQEHDRAADPAQPGDYPTTRVEDREGDITPSAPEAAVDWDEVVQPERADETDDDLPLPEGK